MDTYKVAALTSILFFDGRELLAVRLLVIALITIILCRAILAGIPRKLLIIITLVVLVIRLFNELLISGLAW